ncbi:PD40 domain-containing protein [Desulforamulus aeronauticus]|uniref:TolB protein n=1 Tax=Desulforamulus aeronauticus DSM 10349 TaxID=1121421 RepID=A0A1M6TKR1_9FIRM|nr:PD40 domain-containing protein [Desulforamulus aeronauticus]SHK57513.1 TolB protein [Desulforamulus aeronauticus DSM 10349]
MTEEKVHNQENKVLPMEDYLKARQAEGEGVSHLLSHMRQVRETVPVNRQLQVELRKKLLERQLELKSQGSGQVPTYPEEPANRWKFVQHPWVKAFLGSVAVLLLAFALTGLWRHTSGNYFLEAAGNPQELTRFWTEALPLQPTISPDGTKIVLVRGGSLVVLSETGVQLAALEPPEGEVFRSPAWAPDGKQISYIVSQNGSEEIKHLTTEELLSAREKNFPVQAKARVKQEVASLEIASNMAMSTAAKDNTLEANHYSNLAYAPDGKKLAYVVNRLGGVPEVWVSSQAGQERRVIEGDAPTWSPDGKHLVVQKPSRTNGYELWLVDAQTGDADLLGQGENPVWGANGYLAFSSEKVQERVLTFLPNGEPQYSVRQQVAEMRITYLGKDGSPALKKLNKGIGWLATSHLLVPTENRISGVELNWLRQQELSGSREPKTLILNEVNKCEGQVFGPEGKWLLFARRDGDTVALLKVSLEERWEKERD